VADFPTNDRSQLGRLFWGKVGIGRDVAFHLGVERGTHSWHVGEDLALHL
jgi:hypothetical protein